MSKKQARGSKKPGHWLTSAMDRGEAEPAIIVLTLELTDNKDDTGRLKFPYEHDSTSKQRKEHDATSKQRKDSNATTCVHVPVYIANLNRAGPVESCTILTYGSLESCRLDQAQWRVTFF